ncbi:hypothetical protein T484DRAFT_1753857 [Baffinella frigidus]|nr:hypothetical protein T484DRAFT_1753857 [Cryptophyta sp. CCMP2293]
MDAIEDDAMEEGSGVGGAGVLHSYVHGSGVRVFMDPDDALRALVGAIHKGDLSAIKKMLQENNVDINGSYMTYRSEHPDCDGSQRLRYMCSTGSSRCTAGMVRATPLEAAVCSLRVDIVRLLLAKGAFVTTDVFLWKSAMMNRRTTVIFKLLFARFREMHAEMSTYHVWKKLDIMGEHTSFVSAVVQTGTSNMLQCVVDLGARVNGYDGVHDTVPLEDLVRDWGGKRNRYYHSYQEEEDLEKCRILIENGAKCTSLSSSSKTSLLRVAVESDRTDNGELVRMLLETDLKKMVNHADSSGGVFGDLGTRLTPLTSLLVQDRSNHMCIMRHLHAAGASLTMASQLHSPLMLAARHEGSLAVEFILANMTDEERKSLVHETQLVSDCLNRRNFVTAGILIAAGVECESLCRTTRCTPLYNMVSEGVAKHAKKDRPKMRAVINALLQRGVAVSTVCHPFSLRLATSVVELIENNREACSQALGSQLENRVRDAMKLEMGGRNLAFGGINHKTARDNCPGRLLSDELVRYVASLNDPSIGR